MIKSFKTEISLTIQQQQRFHQSVGICRYLYNLYLHTNKELHQKHLDDPLNNPTKFITQMQFDKWVNNEHSLTAPWVKLCHSKSRKYAVKGGETAFKRFFNKQASFPRFKKKHENTVKLYFYKDNATACKVDRHRMSVPGFGLVHFKEKGYVPVNTSIINGHLSYKAGRYYVSVTIDTTINQVTGNYNDGIGIDLGIKEFAILSTGQFFNNISKTKKVITLRNQLKTKQSWILPN